MDQLLKKECFESQYPQNGGLGFLLTSSQKRFAISNLLDDLLVYEFNVVQNR